MANQFLVKDTFEDIRNISLSEVNDLNIGIYDGLLLLGYYVKGDIPVPVIYYISDTIELDNAGSVIEIGNSIKLEGVYNDLSFINFGVRGGNNLIDDSIQLKKLFDYASKKKINVVNTGGEYYLKQERAIPIKVNVDFGKSIFHLYEEYDISSVGRFEVLPDRQYSNITLPQGVMQQLNSGQSVIDFFKNYKNNYFIIENENQFINRNGGSGGRYYYTELFYIGENGSVMSEISGKLDGYTSCKAYPCSDDFTTIKGGIFKLNCKTSVNGYKISGFNCTRSRVRFIDQIVAYEDDVDYSDNLSPDLGFHLFQKCYDVSMVNIQSVSRANEGNSGTYGLGARYVTKLKLSNVNASSGNNAWGYMGGLHVKDLICENCSVSRIDVHYSAYNIIINNCFLSALAVAGGGVLAINNTTIHSNIYLAFRQDFGSVWSGDIIINNGVLINTTNLRCRILNYQYADFDFGMEQDLSLCNSLKINGFKYINNGGTSVRLNIIDVNLSKLVTIGKNRVVFPQYVELKDMKSINNDGFCPLVVDNLTGGKVHKFGGLLEGGLLTNVYFKCESIDVSNQYPTINQQNGTEQASSDSVYPKFEFIDCQNIKINAANLLCEVVVNGSIVSSYRSVNNNARHTITNSTIALNRIGAIASSFNVTSLNTLFINCLWKLPKLNGVQVESVSDINTILGNASMQFGPLNTEVVYGNHICSNLSSELITKLTSGNASPSLLMYNRLGLTNNIDYNPIIRNVGSTSERSAIAPTGFGYFNTDIHTVQVFNGSIWQNSIPEATVTVKGLINQAEEQPDSNANDVQNLVTDFNSLLTKLRNAGIIAL
ncbi:head fiber protein [Sphingobacterium sp. WOUb80]|uniref:head fiber protein n=1 Tax=Sphingobacterium sp. WOUb80 TaxID=3234028 RepID=UPI003CE9C0F1